VPALIERLQQIADVRIVHTKLAERCFPELIEELSPAPAKGGMLPAVWGDDDRDEDPTGRPARENVQWADMLLIAPATTDLVGDIVGRLETGLLTEIVCNWPADREQLEGARDQMSQSLLKEAPKHWKPIILVPAVNSWQYASMVRRAARAQKPRAASPRAAIPALFLPQMALLQANDQIDKMQDRGILVTAPNITVDEILQHVEEHGAEHFDELNK
jgi:hypothetical protein